MNNYVNIGDDQTVNGCTNKKYTFCNGSRQFEFKEFTIVMTRLVTPKTIT